MDKVRFDFYLGFGVKPIEGDGIWCPSTGEVIVTGAIWYLVNSGGFDWKGVYISNFTERENKGVQPVPDGFPVVLTFNDGERVCHDVPEQCCWRLSDEEDEIKSWKPNYNKLLQMQKEHDAKQGKPIEELMINAKESKMSKNNKHPHHDLIAEWAKDTSKEVQGRLRVNGEWETMIISDVVYDEDDEYEFRFKPREFQKGHWYPCTVKGYDVSYPMIYNGSMFQDFIDSDFGYEDYELTVGESLGEITFGGGE